jgi:hypothetical protein
MSEPYVLTQEQWVPRPVDEVFGFFSDARNLEKLTPPWLGFHILTGGQITIAKGTLIQYRLSWHGLPVYWKTEITCWDPPRSFEDIQLSGPYKLWHHTHRFEGASSGTQMTDVVRYVLPLGPLGRAAHALVVRRNIQQIFDYRRQRIQALFGG